MQLCTLPVKLDFATRGHKCSFSALVPDEVEVLCYVMERLNCTALAVRDDVVEGLWMRLKGMDSKAGVVMDG